MKKMLAATLVLSFLSVSAMSGEITKKHGEAIGMSYVGTFIITGVYASTGAGVAAVVGATTLAGITQAEIKARREVAAKLLLNDVQEFYQDGNVSANLQTAITQMKAANAELSDAEALDQLNETALSILQ
jgi:hypothetical protein